MNDARVDAPTPGSSSVEAYEEDWYRSLRALAERRATELGGYEDEAEQQAEDASPESTSTETPPAGTAAPGTEPDEGPSATAPWSAPSLFDRPHAPVAAAEPAQPDPWAVATPAAAEPSTEQSPTPLAAMGMSSDRDTAEPTSSDVAPSFDASADESTDAGPEAAEMDTVPAEPLYKTSPWARVLRPLERIQLSPVGDPGKDEGANVDDEDAGGSTTADELEQPVAEARADVDDIPSPIGVAPGAEMAAVEAPAETDGIDAGARPDVSVPDLAPPPLSLDEEEAPAASAEHAPETADVVAVETDSPEATRESEPVGDQLDASLAGDEAQPAVESEIEFTQGSEPAAETEPDLESETETAPTLTTGTEPEAEGVVETETDLAGAESGDSVSFIAEVIEAEHVEHAPEATAADAGGEAPEETIVVDGQSEPRTDVHDAESGITSTEPGRALDEHHEPEAEVEALAAATAQPEPDVVVRAPVETHDEQEASGGAARESDREAEPDAAIVEPGDSADVSAESTSPLDVSAETEPEPAGPSLTSRDPAERKTALVALEEREPIAGELDTVAALILDPDAEIRRLAVETLSRTPARLDDGVVRQALQDPADQVRAAAVRAAATRGIRDLPTLAPLVDARHSPETHRTVLELLPKILGGAQLTAEALDPLLLAIARMQPPPDEDERAAFSEIAASIGTTLLIEGLMLPDARRLGAVRLLAGDRSHAVLHALADRAGDPLEEVRQAGLAAAGEIARIGAEAARAEGPPDIGALAEDLRNPDPEHVERALTTLAEVDRFDVVTWCREHLAQGDAEWVATVASLAAVLDLNEIGVELLTRGASLPSERRRPLIAALAEFPDPSQLAGFLAVVPSDKRADAVRLVWEASGRRILPDLRSLLADPTVEVRVAVIDIASDADDPASIEAVAGLLAIDASPEVRAAAVRTISKTEGAFPNIVRALGDPDPHVRATAVESMPSSPASEVGPVLAQVLTDLDERVRLAAIERLAGVSSTDPALAWSALRQCRVEEREELLNAFQRTNPNQVLEIALEHLYSPDQDERKLAAEMTGWGTSQAAVESAIRALGDPVPEVRRSAVGALGRLRDRSAVAALGKTLADPDADVRVGAVRALGVIDDEGVLAFLVAALKDPDHHVRETTSQVLTEWSSPAVAKRLAGVLAVPSLRDSAADLLRRIGPTSVELLIDVLIQGSAEIRFTVGPLLEQIIGIEEFLGRMDSLESERRLRAIEALGAIAGPPAVDALMRSLSDPDERIRLRATQLLGELGDPIAADPVRRLVDDPVADVAAAARNALETNLDSRGPDRPAEYS